jgi:hypothetical protein
MHFGHLGPLRVAEQMMAAALGGVARRSWWLSGARW